MPGKSKRHIAGKLTGVLAAQVVAKAARDSSSSSTSDSRTRSDAGATARKTSHSPSAFASRAACVFVLRASSVSRRSALSWVDRFGSVLVYAMFSAPVPRSIGVRHVQCLATSIVYSRVQYNEFMQLWPCSPRWRSFDRESPCCDGLRHIIPRHKPMTKRHDFTPRSFPPIR